MNNFKKLVHNSNSNNSEKNDDRDGCKECKEYYYVTKQECGWIKCSVCERWLHENCTVFSKTCSDCGHNNRSENLEKRNKVQRNKKESHIDRGYRLFSLITILFTTSLLFYAALYVAHLSQCICQRRPSAYRGIFTSVSK